MLGAAFGALAAPAWGQEAPAEAPPPAVELPPPSITAQPMSPIARPPLPGDGIVRSIQVEGSQRIEPDTVRSYIDLRPGEPYTREALDQALRDLFETELFADVEIRDNLGELTIVVEENPVINRVLLEGNDRVDSERIIPEIRLAPRQIFTRSRVRADVARIIELYRRQGRFAASVEPQMVRLDQNRVDVVFEINEGPSSSVRQINIIGNDIFSDGELRAEMATKQSRFFRFFSSSDTYDPDRLAFDQQRLRQFYLTEGYVDFRVVSAVAELTPDRRDFIITYVVEEGERYRVGEINLDSDLRDFQPQRFEEMLSIQSGDWYNAQEIENAVDSLNETAGLLGYAFAEARPEFTRNSEDRTMDVTFRIEETPRVYVERIDINGNTVTRDKVIRREFRLLEGDAFNSVLLRRSRERIQSLGFFQDNLEIEQQPGSAPDRVVLVANVEERATGQVQISAGFSSLERFLVNLQIQQRNFLGRGQELRAGINYSSYSNSIELGFTEPYLFDRNIALGVDVFRRDLSSFNFLGNERNTTYEQVTTGFQIRAGVPLTEYVSLALRYGLSHDDVTLDENQFFFNGQCDPLLAGRYLCDALGKRITSSLGYSLVYSTLDSGFRPTRGTRLIFSQDVAGLGGDTRYVRSRIDADRYWNLGSGFIFGLSAEAGYIWSFENREGPGVDDVRLTDRFFLGEPQIRGFDIRGVGPRVRRTPFLPNSNELNPDTTFVSDDALGGRAYYLGRAELEIPIGSGGRELGFRPSIFMDVGAVFGLTDPVLTSFPCVDADPEGTDTTGATSPCPEGFVPQALSRPILDADGNPQYVVPASQGGGFSPQPLNPDGTNRLLFAQTISPFLEEYLGDSPAPRLTIGAGVSWNSPFGPFRVDLAFPILTQEGDDTKIFTFSVGTQF